MRHLLAIVVIGVGLFLTDAALAQSSVLYHSPANNGTRAADPTTIPANLAVVHLYVDGGSTPSTNDPCYAGAGDEICAYLFHLTTQGGMQIVSFTPASGVVARQTTDELSLTGGDFLDGQLGPTWIGDVVVDGQLQDQLVLSSGETIGAALDSDAVPAVSVVTVPEPSLLAGLIAGVVTHALLARRHGPARSR
jgi:hypothetical protein